MNTRKALSGHFLLSVFTFCELLILFYLIVSSLFRDDFVVFIFKISNILNSAPDKENRLRMYMCVSLRNKSKEATEFNHL